MKTLLVPIDFSGVTDRLVAEAADLARSVAGRIVLLNVTEPAVGVVDYSVVSLTTAAANEPAIKRARERLAVLEAQVKAEHVPVESRHILGTPTEEIVGQAANLGADYIVVGSHGHGRIYDALVGSTTNGVLKCATCPVLVVPAHAPLRGPVLSVETEIMI